ncbi:MAG: site-specific integrase [Alphaproteobacteria bacterium]|nr:MAG: site-specific integrase [Alphaproteobacteria bacterium]
MPKEKITKRKVDAIKPGPRDRFIWDTELHGFGLKVTPAGAKVYIVQYRMGGRDSRTKRFTIGKHGSPWTPEKARKQAREILEGVRKGTDPMLLAHQKKQENQRLAFRAYADDFIERYAKTHQKRSWMDAQRILDREFKPVFKDRPINKITKGEIWRALEGMKDRPALCKYAHATLRKLFRWAVSLDDIQVSPVEGIKAPAKVEARDRVLTDAELRAVWLACDALDYPFGPFVRLLIATGQRRSEVAGMDWAEIDCDAGVWTIPGDRAKNGQAHTVPLNDVARAILDALGAMTSKRGLVFTSNGKTPISGFSKAKKRLDKQALALLQAKAAEAGHKAEDVILPPWRYHDLRRTVATGLQRLGTRLEVTEAVLNHVSGSRAGIVGVYQRYNWADEKRTALDAWGAHLTALVEGADRGANVVALADRRA